MNIDYDALREDYESEISCASADEVCVLVDAIKDGAIARFVLRFVWAICEYCHGDGTHSRRFGSFSADEWNELDGEFREGYLSGRFDRSCEVCNGSGKVRELDEDCLTDEARAYLERYRDAAYSDAMLRYHEQRMGC